MSPHFAPRKDTTKRHVLFIGWSPASCIIDRRKREGGGSIKEGREEREGNERKGRERKKGERKGRKERAFFSVAFWLIPYAAKVRDGE